MDYIIQEIELLLQLLTDQKENYIQKMKNSPPGGLFRTVRKKHYVYMHSVPDGMYPSGQIRYRRAVLSEGSDLLKRLVLKEYYRVSLKLLDNNIRCLQHAKAGLLPLTYEFVRSRMRKTYHFVSNTLLSAGFSEDSFLRLNDERFLRQHQWAAEPYEMSAYRPEEKIHITSRGLAVRSRAELLIAEMLYRYDIPFRYEQVIRIGKYDLAPDFTFLDCNGEEFYWEFCGMMAEMNYRSHQLWRRSMYENIGINEWTNMICTYDAKDRIDMREIEAVIKTKILPRMQGI